MKNERSLSLHDLCENCNFLEPVQSRRDLIGFFDILVRNARGTTVPSIPYTVDSKQFLPEEPALFVHSIVCSSVRTF